MNRRPSHKHKTTNNHCRNNEKYQFCSNLFYIKATDPYTGKYVKTVSVSLKPPKVNGVERLRFFCNYCKSQTCKHVGFALKAISIKHILRAFDEKKREIREK